MTPDQPERAAVRHHPGVEGQPQQPPRRTTLTDLPKAQPPAPKPTLSGFPAPPPALPLEYAATKRPPLPWGKTVRAESLPEVVAAARRTDPPTAPAPPPTSARVPPDEAALSARQRDREAILEAELAKSRAATDAEREKVAKLERDARAAAEARIQSFPPTVEPAPQQSPAPKASTASAPPGPGDWEKLRFKVATAIVASLVLVIAALGYWAVTAINAKTEAIKAAQEAKRNADSRDAAWRQWASVVTWIEDCRDGRDVRSGEMLLPDPQKMGSARKLEPWQNPCSPKLPPPP